MATGIRGVCSRAKTEALADAPTGLFDDHHALDADLTRFTSAADLSCGASRCPGNNESVGKRGNPRARKGSSWLRGALGEAAQAARHQRPLPRRFCVRGVPYQDPGPGYRRQRVRDPKRRINHLTHELLALGCTVEITSPAA